MQTFKDIIGLWDSHEALGSDLGESKNTIHGWSRRYSIPPHYWPRILRAAKARGYKLEESDLIRAAVHSRTDKIRAIRKAERDRREAV